jgi:hypothetical protein
MFAWETIPEKQDRIFNLELSTAIKFYEQSKGEEKAVAEELLDELVNRSENKNLYIVREYESRN